MRTLEKLLKSYLAHKWNIASISDTHIKRCSLKLEAVEITFGDDEGEEKNVNPDGAPDGPTINRFSAVNTNYGKTGGVEQIPFTLQQPGSFSLKRRPSAYKVTRGDSNE